MEENMSTKMEAANNESNVVREKKVVAIVSPKGGIGKSTIATHMATILNYMYRNNDFKVSILDADFLQRNIDTKRKKELEKLETDVKFKELVESLEMPLYQIDTTDEEYLIEIIEEMREESDILFVDLPGTLLNKKILESLLYINYILIPFYPEEEFEEDSTLNFIDNIIPILKGNKKKKLVDAAVIFNRYSETHEKMKVNPYESMAKKLDDRNFKYFNSKIYQRKDFQRHKSTILPIKPNPEDPASFYYVVQEFTKFIMN